MQHSYGGTVEGQNTKSYQENAPEGGHPFLGSWLSQEDSLTQEASSEFLEACVPQIAAIRGLQATVEGGLQAPSPGGVKERLPDTWKARQESSGLKKGAPQRS